MMRLVLVVSLFFSVTAQLDPTNFVVTSSATFSCTVSGSRCTFLRSDYSQDPIAPFGTVQETVGTSVFTALEADDTLTVNDCQTNSRCLVLCNDSCSCIDNDTNEACGDTTFSPTASPTVEIEPDTNFVCPEKTSTDACSSLMPKVPVGTFCDCYNFCQGNFTSCCEREGQCGTLECEASEGTTLGASGTVNGQVLGCTDKDRPASSSTSDSGSGGGGGGGSSGAFANTSFLLSLLAATAMVGLSLW